MSTENQLAKLDSTQFIEIINRMPNLSDDDRRSLAIRVASDDVEIRRAAFEKMTQSAIAQSDLAFVQGELNALSNKGKYVDIKQTLQTGSGSVVIHTRGGDTKLIIPVLVIVGIVIIAALVIVFWR